MLVIGWLWNMQHNSTFLKKSHLVKLLEKGNFVYRGSCVLRSYGQQYIIQETVFGIVQKYFELKE